MEWLIYDNSRMELTYRSMCAALLDGVGNKMGTRESNVPGIVCAAPHDVTGPMHCA